MRLVFYTAWEIANRDQRLRMNGTRLKMERVILVDENDNPLGTMEKMEAHEKGVLHRAFSVFIFNNKGEMLLQQRAFSKYHSGGLWTNTCCSHPREGEATIEAAHRRLQEEMGFDCDIEKAFDFIYKKELDQGLTGARVRPCFYWRIRRRGLL